MRTFTLLHAMNTVVSILLGEYLFALGLQGLFLLFVFFHTYKPTLEIMLFMQNILLYFLFSYPFFYFVYLAFVGYILYLQNSELAELSFVRFFSVSVVVSAIYFYFEPLLYEFTIALDFPYSSFHFEYKLFFILTILHIIIFFVIKKVNTSYFKKN